METTPPLLPSPRLFHGELGSRIGFQALVGDRQSAADGPAEGPILQPLFGPIKGRQSIAHASADRVVDTFGAQRLRPVRGISRLILRAAVLASDNIEIHQKRTQLAPLRLYQRACSVLIHLALRLSIGRSLILAWVTRPPRSTWATIDTLRTALDLIPRTDGHVGPDASEPFLHHAPRPDLIGYLQVGHNSPDR